MRVSVMWKGEARAGLAVGQEYGDSLPTGARFIPVTFDDDGTTHNVDTRIVTPA